jgi:hypothetical protein
VEVRETKARIEIFDGPRLLASHERQIGAHDLWVTLPEHRRPRGGRPKDAPSAEEVQLLEAEPALSTYVTALRRHAHGRGTLALRRLLRLLRDYPREAFLAAIGRAEQFGLYDLDRVERLVLKQIAHDYFVLPADSQDGDDDDE